MGEDPSPGLAESGLLLIVPCTYQHIRCRLRRRACGAAGLAGVNGDVAKEGFRDTGRRHGRCLLHEQALGQGGLRHVDQPPSRSVAN